MRDLHQARSDIDSTVVGQGEGADDGVDVTLIRWMLSLRPRQRLLVLQRNVQSILRLRDARSKS